jgi:hypothetical protein
VTARGHLVPSGPIARPSSQSSAASRSSGPKNSRAHANGPPGNRLQYGSVLRGGVQTIAAAHGRPQPIGFLYQEEPCPTFSANREHSSGGCCLSPCG